MKTCLCYQGRMCPVLAFIPISALLLSGVRKSSSSSHRPPSSSLFSLFSFTENLLIRVCCAYGCHFFFFFTSKSLFNSLISVFHSHQACKVVLLVLRVMLPNPRVSFRPSHFLAAGSLCWKYLSFLDLQDATWLLSSIDSSLPDFRMAVSQHLILSPLLSPHTSMYYLCLEMISDSKYLTDKYFFLVLLEKTTLTNQTHFNTIN